MAIKDLIKSLALMAVGGTMFNATANSVGFNEAFFLPGANVSITVNYDFTDFAMFGGGVDIIFDPASIGNVSWTPGELEFDAQAPASPDGMLIDGAVIGAGIGTFEFFNGMTSAGQIGTLTFTFLGGPGSSAVTPCGAIICLIENDINPFVSLDGQSVGPGLLAAGFTSVYPFATIPVPAAVWFMLSGLGVLFGFGRKQA